MTVHTPHAILLTDAEQVALARDLRSARQTATQWVLDRLQSDGQPVGGEEWNAYYRVPWSLALVGEREAAISVLGWIERTALAEGDFVAGAPRRPFESSSAAYPLAIVAMGAWHLERFDTALAIMETLRKDYQDADSGGAFTERPDKRLTGRQDLCSTAQLGLSALTTGQPDIALKARDWVLGLLAAQPEMPSRLYTMWDSQGLVIESAPDLQFSTVVDFDRPRQAYFNPGIAAAFLGRYHASTGDKVALDAARHFLTLYDRATPRMWNYGESKQVCKYAWGASVMLEIAPEADYMHDVCRMGRWLVDSQETDGRWHQSPFLVPNSDDIFDLQKTSEHLLYVVFVLTALASWLSNVGSPDQRFQKGPTKEGT